MKTEIDASSIIVLAALAAAGLYVWSKGGLAPAAAAAGAAAVNAAGSAASGAVGAVGASVGLPTPDETTTDPAVARWLIDGYGYLEASKWAGAVALGRAAFMDAGSGTPPPAGSAVAMAHPGAATGSSITAPQDSGPALSFYRVGLSFKDLSDPEAVNPWRGAAVGLLPD